MNYADMHKRYEKILERPIPDDELIDETILTAIEQLLERITKLETGKVNVIQ